MRTEDSTFNSRHLLDRLARLPSPRKYWIGFSGGADSTALLQAMCECRKDLAVPIHAAHFHHGLQADADSWLDHCRSFCTAREIPFHSERLEIDTSARGSPEEEARNSRYRAVAGILGEREMYLTAHHSGDQAETLFLNLMRGSGVEGLAGIPVLRNLEAGWVARPLLDCTRPELERFLESRDIPWLTDPSNADTSFDRNYLRRDLFPQLETRWPGLTNRLARTARNARITAGAMAMFIESQSGDLIRDRLKMPLQKLLELDPEMQTLILRQWLRRHEVPVLPEARLREFLDQLSGTRVESQAEVQWEDWMIKRYKHELWLHRRSPFIACPKMKWKSGMKLELGPDTGWLRLSGKNTNIPDAWKVRARKPGDRIRTVPDGPSRKLKQLFQSALIPPWLRPGIPVLEWDGEPVALGDWVIGHRLQSWLFENNLTYQWRPSDPVLNRVRTDSQR
ncbi:MAG: tRNA lysidine(34) synthetase TilS [Xanthomonadales bacterium]|nr:tRNA lysidine(34) synthetase TilS [Gammaproteobacteria bacterium]MBT8055014.1 tRNA lysidine(34) synthetase TilS [Gammaproteobacteria bacterium]NND56396.1 tRNA lysidine(34) synthetase TilS [Xanthomonadales bacterium]NNK50453.1 tRNA lysidine(34) synthetase TilS [Xanthomonadales bacterium]